MHRIALDPEAVSCCTS